MSEPVWFSIAIYVYDIPVAAVSEVLGPPDFSSDDDAAERAARPAVRWAKLQLYWMREAKPDGDRDDLERGIRRLVERFDQPLSAWRPLRQAGRLRLSVGAFMGSSNNGFELPPDLLCWMGERGLAFSYALYRAEDDDPPLSPSG